MLRGDKENPTSKRKRSSYRPVHSGYVVTTEKTSKALKSHTVYAWLAIIVTAIGVIATWGGSPIWWVALVFSFIYRAIVGFAIWWEHG